MADINGIDVRIASEIPDQEAEEFLNILRRHLKNKHTRCESEDKGNPPRINECEYCTNGKNLNCQYDSYAKIIPVGGTHKYFSVYLLEFDNSGGEYPKGNFEINFCPICGRKLNLGYEPYR